MSFSEENKKAILLVEDEVYIALDEAAMLRNNGFTVITAQNGSDAIEAVRHNPVDLVLMDIDLGRESMDGTAAAALILGEKELPIVFLTSHSEKGTVERVKNITRYGYVLKNAGEFVLLESIAMAFELFEAHQRLLSKEVELRAIIDNIDDAILRYNREGKVIFFSRGAEKVFGFKAEEVIGRRGTETINPAVDSAGRDHEEMLANIFWNPEKYRYHENENIRKDGKVLLIAWSNKAVYDEKGQTLFMQCIGRDITKQREMEERQAESERRFRQLFENSPISLWEEDFSCVRDYIRKFEGREGFDLKEHFKDSPEEIWELIAGIRITDVNQATIRLLEAENKEEVLGSLGDIFPDQSVDIFIEEIDSLYKKGSFSSEIIGYTIKKREIDCVVDVCVAPGCEETWNRVTVSITDVSKLKRIERQKEFLLRELNHRIKNNLAIIGSLISLKTTESGSSMDLTDIKTQIDAIRIIHDKLNKAEDISRISFKNYAEDLLISIFSSLSPRPVTLDLSIEEITPPTKAAVPLGLIINEVATNAIKHGFDFTIEPVFTVILREDRERDCFVLALSNNGRPFPKDVEVDAPKTLGLRIISVLIEQLEGRMELTRQPNTVFEIFLPLKNMISL